MAVFTAFKGSKKSLVTNYMLTIMGLVYDNNEEGKFNALYCVPYGNLGSG